MSSRRLGPLVLRGLLIILCHHIPETSAAVEAVPRQLQASTNVTNTNANVTAVAANTNTSTTATETQLSQPDCLAVGNEFICEINLLLEQLSDGTPTETVVVDAALTCPLNTAANTTSAASINVTWTDVDPRTCGCVAALSYPDGGQGAKECPCRYCSTGVEAGSDSVPLSIDCSALTDNPYVQGTCQHVGCDGSCLDPANSTTAPATSTTTPPETPEPTQTDPPETSSTSEPSPLSNGTCVMDFPFCPENRQVPPANLDIMIDPILERTCGSLHESRNDPRDPMVNVDCDSLKSYGALCCTEDIVEEVDTMAPLETSPPTEQGTQIITIPSLFLVYNLYNLSAAPLMEGPEWEIMQASYAAFVELVVLEKLLLDGDTTDNSTTSSASSSSNTTEPSASNATATRYLRGRQILLTEDEVQQQQQREEAALSAMISHPHRRRRRLQVLLDSASIQVHSFNNTECPTTIPFEALCVAVHASYDLFVYQDINSNATIYEDYTNYTQEAVDRGLLNQTMEAVDPYTVLIVEGSLPIVTDDSPEEPNNYVQGSGYEEYWMVGLGVSITIIVFCLVAILCASDWSGHDMDDDSVDPWEKESKGGSKAGGSLHSRSGSKASLHSRVSSHKERAPRRGKRGTDDDDDKTDKQTERQEYEMYRGQIEELIEKKTPEELDNIDELMDLFYQRELILIATLKHMPDAFDGIVGEGLGISESSSGSSSEEFGGRVKKNENMNTTEERLEDSMFWNSDDGNSEDGSSGEFGEESAPQLNLDASDSDDDEEKKNDKKIHRTGTAPIEEGDEDEDSTNRSDADPEPIVAKKAAEPVLKEEASDEEDKVDASETKNDKENAESDSDNDEQEDTTEPRPDAKADSAEAGGEASDDDSGNAADETWDDEDAQEKEQSKTPSPPPTPSEEKDSDDDGDLD